MKMMYMKLHQIIERANNIIRKLTECGWIYLELTNDYKQIINF